MLQRGQLCFGCCDAGFSSASTETDLDTLVNRAGGVSGAESVSGGDPGAEKGESGGEPGPESAGDSGGDLLASSGLDSSPVTRLVAELNSDDPKLNIWEAAAGGFPEVSDIPPNPPNNFPATDSSCLAVV